MLARSNSIRVLPAKRVCTNPKPFHPPIRIPFASSPSNARFQSGRPRYGNYGRRSSRFDPDAARRARPLLTIDQVGRVADHGGTKVIGVVVVVGGVVFYYSHQEIVPVSGRQRFNCFSDESVEGEGALMYKKIMMEYQGAILPDWDRRSKMVHRVMSRLIPASEMEHVDWEVHVIDSPEMNAFVIPGGKVFVFSGILPIAKTDDGLGAILGHEIAHNLARHAAESMSSMVLLEPVRWIFISLDVMGITGGLGRILGDIALNFGLMRPASRKQESEADYIGLMMMSKACYEPSAAVGVWQRMEKAQAVEVPAWLSTHPTNASRIEKIQEWLPKAEMAREESGCAATSLQARAFADVLGGWRGFGEMH
ncbi:peptidase family M48-domain-containing protein [Amylocarpus encephaloides]|uniref:Peptidase family M48-domain-containing protein n=1 Tax=Amylocarpus encephaloides TaxID=45428 RepID=A0A9P8C110_9HELO|nr:peptidase family M48-domain-containing protein [Amylocarpus encephaloides]